MRGLYFPSPAGGILSLNKLYVAPPDGLQISLVQGTMAAVAQLTSDQAARFDMTKFSKILLVLLVCASVGFFGLAAMSATSMSNVKTRLEKAKAEKKVRADKLAALQAELPKIPDVEAKTNDVRKWNPADMAAMDARADVMAKQLMA